MAFVKKTWKDRIVQYANRRLLTKSGGEVEQVTVTRDEGTISEAGDQFNASNMNDLENRVKNAFDNVDTALSGKANTSSFIPKSVSTASAITVSANTIDTQDLTVNNSIYNIVVGFQLSNSINFAMVQCYFENSTTIRTRVRNLANTSDSYQIKVFYI